MLLSKPNVLLAACAASTPRDTRSYRDDYMRVDQSAQTITTITACAMYVSALPDQAIEAEFPRSDYLNPAAGQPLDNFVYLPATAVKAVGRLLPRPPRKQDRQYPDSMYPVLQHARVTQAPQAPAPQRQEYILETNDLVTATFTPVEVRTTTESDNITWPPVEEIPASDQADKEREKRHPDTAIPSIVLSVDELKTLVKIHKAHKIDRVQISVSRTNPLNTLVTFTGIRDRDKPSPKAPAIKSYLMPMAVFYGVPIASLEHP